MPQRPLEAQAHLGQAAARRHAGRAGDVQRQVPVAESEPRLLAVGTQLGHRGVGVALDPPAPGNLLDACEVVEHRVVVGHHEQPVPPAIVPGVDDDREPGSELGLEPVGQLRAADPAGQRDDAPFTLSPVELVEDLADPVDRLEVVGRRGVHEDVPEPELHE